MHNHKERTFTRGVSIYKQNRRKNAKLDKNLFLERGGYPLQAKKVKDRPLLENKG